MAQPRYDLVYFNIRAFAEPIRMLLHHRGLAYRYWMPWDYFGKPWAEAKQDVAFGEVPVLVVDGGTMLWESAAIMRYLANGTSLMPDDATPARWKRIGTGRPPITRSIGAAPGPAKRAVPFLGMPSISTTCWPPFSVGCPGFMRKRRRGSTRLRSKTAQRLPSPWKVAPSSRLR